MKDLTKHVVLDFMQMKEFAKNPFIFVEGKGIRIRDIDDNWYIDGLSGVFVASLGHGNAEVCDAVCDQIRTLAFGPPLHSTNPPALMLAKMLTDISPPGIGTVKLLSGGSEATEAALKMARQFHVQTGHPRKFKVIATYESYHGGTMGALSATGGWDRKSIFEPLMPGFLHIHPANEYECQYGHTRGQCGEDDALMLKRMIEAEDPDTISSVIMSPVLISSAGFVVPPRDYFKRIREICDRYNVLLIFDEIITGFGRLGTMFGADYFGVIPDFICCGKGMSGGYAPLAAVLFKDSVNEAFLGEPGGRREFHHGHTYGGNPVSCAAGIAALKQILDRSLVQRASEMGSYLRARLERIADRYRFVLETRGVGLLQGYQFVKTENSAALDDQVHLGKRVGQAARERGLLVRAGNDFIALAPPLVVTTDEIDEMCSILDDSLQAVAGRMKHRTVDA